MANSERAKTYTTEAGPGRTAATSPRSTTNCRRSPTAHGRGTTMAVLSLRPRRRGICCEPVAACRPNSASAGSSSPSRRCRDFTGAFDRQNQRLALFGLIAIAVANPDHLLPVIGVISSPLERLAGKVGKIEELGGEQLPPIQSPIREIAVLLEGDRHARYAVKSFAAFVPVGLVQQLLQSDAEAGARRPQPVPDDLLLRPRSVLDALGGDAVPGAAAAGVGLSRARHQDRQQEPGTIDKFIGDGVMAFWGAPALLEDHAWRACVAALRIQRGMEALNARWQAGGTEAAAAAHRHPQRRRAGRQYRLARSEWATR